MVLVLLFTLVWLPALLVQPPMDYPITPSTMARDLLMLSPMVSLSTLSMPPAMLEEPSMATPAFTMVREMLSLMVLVLVLLSTLVWPLAMLVLLPMVSLICTMAREMLSLRLLQRLLLKLKQMLMLSTMVVMDMDSQVDTHLSVEFMDMDIHMPTGVNLLQ